MPWYKCATFLCTVCHLSHVRVTSFSQFVRVWVWKKSKASPCKALCRLTLLGEMYEYVSCGLARYPYLCSLRERGFRGKHRCGVTLLSGMFGLVRVPPIPCSMLITRVELFFLLIGQNRSRNQRSGMILEVQIQSFGEHWLMRIKVSIFKKISGGPKY